MFFLLLLPSFTGIYFIIDLLLISMVDIRWFIYLVIPKTWISHKKFKVAYHIFQIDCNFLLNHTGYITFIFHFIFDLFVI